MEGLRIRISSEMSMGGGTNKEFGNIFANIEGDPDTFRSGKFANEGFLKVLCISSSAACYGVPNFRKFLKSLLT